MVKVQIRCFDILSWFWVSASWLRFSEIEPKLPPTTTTTTPATTTTTTTTAKEKFVLEDPDKRPNGFGGGKNPDVIINGQELASRNGYPPRGGTYGSTPEVKPSGELSSLLRD